MIARVLTFFSLTLFLTAGLVACGSSGGGGGGSLEVEGTLRNDSSTSRELAPGDGGIAGVTVSALGGSAVTDENGNFTLSLDGETFSGGEALFLFSGPNIETSAVIDNVLGGPENTAFVDFAMQPTGRISGESFDAAGTLIGSTPGGRLNCSQIEDFVDGGLNALWKPFSEKTGAPVILMPAQYQSASVEVFNNIGQVVDGPVLRNCCEHNAGREHVYLSRNARDLATTGLPLTVRFEFPDGFVDCRTVPDPTQRYD